jgi:hypothetical protein
MLPKCAMKAETAIKDLVRWVYLGLTFLTFASLEILAIYYFYKAMGVI